MHVLSLQRGSSALNLEATSSLTQGGIATGALLADKGYDANTLLDWLKERSMTAGTPPKANRKVQREWDWSLYKERHVVECRFGRLKSYRRIVTRFEKNGQPFQRNVGLCSSSVVATLGSLKSEVQQSLAIINTATKNQDFFTTA